jgi:hypothetical protein
MIARRVQNGVVVLDDNVRLPDGTLVIVWPETPFSTQSATQELPPEEQHRRLLEAINRIAALPLEGPSETFRGADHDQALYARCHC